MELFKGWFKDQRQPALALRWLHSQGALSCGHGPTAGLDSSIKWAESQPTWPNGSRPRSIVIELSRKVLAEIAQ
jgi:hypothetical protein